MKNVCFTLILAVNLTITVMGGPVIERHQQLWAKYETALTQPGLPQFRQGRFFLPATQFKTDASYNQQQADEYADRLIELARAELADNAAYAYQLLHEAAYFGRDNLADKIVSAKSVELKSRRASSTHPRLRWKRREYFRITSAHYQIVCRDEKAGFEIARRLETLHSVWRQLFLACWSDEASLRSALDKGKTLAPRTHRLHRVVLFSNQQEYTEFLKNSQPRIGITKGFYDIAARSSYFFAGEQSTHATQLHEATHQLLQEVQATSERLGLSQNFWAVEGIAMYMESLQRYGPVVLVGGVGARRLQFARYRRLQEEFYVPLRDLVSYGRNQLQQDPRIRRIYSQSAGLTHFMMDDEDARHRHGFVRYLKLIYQGRDRVDSLSEALQAELTVLDQRYEHFLKVGDDEVSSPSIPVDSLQSLCLGNTDVTNDGLKRIPRQGKLEWLDLANLPVDNSGLKFLSTTQTLRQLSFDQCTLIDDEVVELIAQNAKLEELDLSATRVTDQGLKHLSGHSSLRTLWLSGTQLTDASLPVLASLKSLTTLGCQGTQLSEAGLKSLQNQNPNLSVE